MNNDLNMNNSDIYHNMSCGGGGIQMKVSMMQ